VVPTQQPTLRFDDGGWVRPTAGHVALELTNTVAWRRDPARTVDRIATAGDLSRWARFVGVLRPGPPGDPGDPGDDARSAEIVRDVHRVRESLYRVLSEIAAGEPVLLAAHADLVAMLLDRVRATPIRTPMPLRWAATASALDEVPQALAVEALQLLLHEDPSRLRQCRSQACGWLFLDRSKNGSRVWCSSRDCGNRDRARRQRARARATL
jgi:predicted RNA-binding Zn ribbon-like protein